MTIPEPQPQVLFLLSPAHSGGRRAQILMSERATFPLAARLREGGAPLGEVFQFLSGLYFRGKLAYAGAFARRDDAREGTYVIAPGLGLLPPTHVVTYETMLAMAQVGVAPDDLRFREPLARDAYALAAELGAGDLVVLLGSIATGKYVDVLESCLGGRLRFPAEFVGRGDMSRGGLMLRRAIEGHELEYVALPGAVRHGKRPPRLSPIRHS